MININREYRKMRRARGRKQNKNPGWGMLGMGNRGTQDALGPPIRRICPRCQVTPINSTEVNCERCVDYIQERLS